LKHSDSERNGFSLSEKGRFAASEKPFLSQIADFLYFSFVVSKLFHIFAAKAAIVSPNLDLWSKKDPLGRRCAVCKSEL
jgi:hypothetical protein